MPAYAKFAGILFILWVALLYSADGTVRRLVRPLVHVAFPVMRAVTWVVSIVIAPITLVGGLLQRAVSRG